MATGFTNNGSFEGVSVITWGALGASESGDAIEVKGSRSIAASVQMVGTFGASSVVLEGSNDGTNYVTLKDASSAAISFAANGLVEFSNSTRYIRPRAVGAITSVAVTVVMKG